MENLTVHLKSNHWSVSQLSQDNLRYSNLGTALLIIAYTLIFLLGFVGNAAVIIVLYSKRKMRTVTNLFVLNSAVADLLVVLFCVPVTLMANIFIRKFKKLCKHCLSFFGGSLTGTNLPFILAWIFGTFICKVFSYAQGVSVFASVYSLAAISTDRFVWRKINNLKHNSNILSSHIEKLFFNVDAAFYTALSESQPVLQDFKQKL